MRMSAMGQKRTCTRFKFGIYGRVRGAIAISFNRGSNAPDPSKKELWEVSTTSVR
jgi:hypothetical protein